MLIFEFDQKFHRPGKYFEIVGGKKFFRFWAAFFCITWTEFDLKTLHNYIADGNTVWRN